MPLLRIEPVPGYSPTIGRLVCMLTHSRQTLLAAVEGLSLAELDQLHDARSNSIGALLAHVAAVERWYQVLTFEDREPSAGEVAPWLPALDLGDEGRRRLKGRELQSYLDALAEIRRATLAAFAERGDTWLEAPLAAAPTLNAHWAWFHVAEDEISHRGQIRWLRGRLRQVNDGATQPRHAADSRRPSLMPIVNPTQRQAATPPMPLAVLLLGGTGRTGRCVLETLLGSGATVRAIVRSAERLPPGARGRPGLTVVEADLLAMPDEVLARHVSGCDAIVSCLGHTIGLAGVFGPPRDLVTRAVARLCRAVEATRPERPVRFVLMSSVSVDHPGGGDPRRTWPERALLRVLLSLVPPTRDNQRAADFLHDAIGPAHPCVQWVVVRPDTLLEGDVGGYALDAALRVSLFRPASTRMASVAHFMCDLVTHPDAWEAWRGKLPVIVDAPAPAAPGPPR